MAFAPDNRFDESWFHAVASCRGANRAVLAAFEPVLPPPVRNGASHEQQDQNRKQPTPFHAVYVAHTGRRVESHKRRQGQ